MWTLVLLLLISIVMFFYSERITSSFLGFFSQYPIIRLAPKSQHQANSNYIRIGSAVFVFIFLFLIFLEIKL